jgi:hypothetical protein
MLRREKPFGRRIDAFVELHRARRRREFLRLGVQFADGTMTTNLDQPPFHESDVEPAGPLLVVNGVIVDQRRFDLSYWVWRLPPPRPVTFVCQWPACGIEDAGANRRATRPATPRRSVAGPILSPCSHCWPVSRAFSARRYGPARATGSRVRRYRSGDAGRGHRRCVAHTLRRRARRRPGMALAGVARNGG